MNTLWRAIVNFAVGWLDRDERFRHDRAMERYAREHPGTRLVEVAGRLWIDSTPQPIDLDGIRPSALGGLMGPIDVKPMTDWLYPVGYIDPADMPGSQLRCPCVVVPDPEC